MAESNRNASAINARAKAFGGKPNLTTPSKIIDSVNQHNFVAQQSINYLNSIEWRWRHVDNLSSSVIEILTDERNDDVVKLLTCVNGVTSVSKNLIRLTQESLRIQDLVNDALANI